MRQGLHDTTTSRPRARRWMRAYVIDEGDLEHALSRGELLWRDLCEAEERWLERADARLAARRAADAPGCAQALLELLSDAVGSPARSHTRALELLCQYTGQELPSGALDALDPTGRAALDAALLDAGSPWTFEAMLGGEAPGELGVGREGESGWSSPEQCADADAFLAERLDELRAALDEMEWEGAVGPDEADAAREALDELCEWAALCAAEDAGLATFLR